MTERAKGFDIGPRTERLLADLRPATVPAEAWRGAGEAGRLAMLREAARPPEVCGPEIIPQPAAGPRRAVEMREQVGGRSVRSGYAGRAVAMRADVFDRMLADARARDLAPPLSHGQIAMARLYRDTVERYSAGGVRCASLEAGRGGAGGGDFMDARLVAGRRIDAMRARVGDGVALTVRRLRPSVRGSRAVIRDIVLVDSLCLRDLTLSEVLSEHGWAKDRKLLDALRGALAGALDRMMGYDLVRPHARG